ncbi:Terminase small subunit [Rhizobium sp. BR 362]|uniref:Terminase small subunit n=1 Tax=Rhizobium sp. BR 362 TaxID=3040670 RepID=UPI002F41ABCB
MDSPPIVGELASIAYPYPMPPLSNQRHEGFCRLISRGEAASRAYGAVYHTTGNNAEAAASRLLRNVKVANRIAELKGAAAKRTLKTVESLVSDLDEVIVFARQCGNPAAMVSAIAAQARLLGLEAPKQLEVMHKPAPLPTKVLELTEAEWQAQFSTGRGPKPALTGAGRRRAAAKRLNGHPLENPVSNATVIGDTTKPIGWLDLDEAE